MIIELVGGGAEDMVDPFVRVFNIDTTHGTSLLRAQSNAFDAATINALRKDVNELLPALQRVE